MLPSINALSNSLGPHWELPSREGLHYSEIHHRDWIHSRSGDRETIVVLPHDAFDKFILFFCDPEMHWNEYPLIIHNNGMSIMGNKDNLICDRPGIRFGLIFLKEFGNWVIHQNFDTKDDALTLMANLQRMEDEKLRTIRKRNRR